MDTIFSLWINQDQRNGQERRAKKTKDKRVSEHLCHMKSNRARMVTHSPSFLQRTVIYFRKVQFDIFVTQKVICKIDGFWVLTNNRFLSLSKNTVFFKLKLFSVLSVFASSSGAGPDIYFSWHLPRKRAGTGWGLYGGDAGEVHGGRKAEAETRPQERRGHRVVWTLRQTDRLCVYVCIS